MTVYEIETQRIVYRTYHVEADSPGQAKQLLADNYGDYWPAVGEDGEDGEWIGDETVSRKKAKKLPARYECACNG